MLYVGIANFLNTFLAFIVSPADQPQKYIVFAVGILLVNVLIAVIDWKWGRGIGFTALALLAGAFTVYVSVVILQGMRQSLDRELTEPESWASFGFYLRMVYWYIFELPIILGLGIGAVVLAALSRQRGWVMGNAIALALTVLAPLLAVWIIRAISAGTDVFNPLAIHARDVRLFQADLAFVVILFAILLLYLSYGVWRIRRSSVLGSQPTSGTSLPSVQS